LQTPSRSGPGMTVAQEAVLGARGCAFKDLEAWTVYGGNPARALKRRRMVEGRGGEGSGEPAA
jgi:acetyltransferase-like isoleucine patch superfamily enzyme